MEIKIKEMGLAGYLRIKNIKFLGYINDMFCFESDITADEWNIEYMNTKCFTHDREIMSLRNLVNHIRGKR